MPFPYYAKLKPRQKAIYRRSDSIVEVELPGAEELSPLVESIQQALALEERAAIERAAAELSAVILQNLGVTPARIKVLSVRPSNNWGELHGEYHPAEGQQRAVLRVWMRTEQQKKIVAFRTFLRTLLHELCHHLDYELLELADSFHTDGFFKRESSLFKQLMREN